MDWGSTHFRILFEARVASFLAQFRRGEDDGLIYRRLRIGHGKSPSPSPVSLANFVRRDANGEVVVDSRAIHLPEERPLVLWGQPTPPHTLENVGEDPIQVIVVESKPPSDRPG